MTDVQAIQALQLLLSDPSRWTVGAEARTADGTPCEPLDPNAASWAAPGAACKVLNDESKDAKTGHRNAWLRLGKYIMAFSPALGRDGNQVTHASLMTRLQGALMVAHLMEKKT